MYQAHKIKLCRANLKRDLRTFSNMVTSKYIKDSLCFGGNGLVIKKIYD